MLPRQLSYVRFPDPEYHRNFLEQRTKVILPERGLVLTQAAEVCPDFLHQLHRRNWSKLAENPGRANATWTREFYAMLCSADWSLPEPFVIIRGVPVPIGTETINDVYGLDDIPELELEARDVDGNGPWLVEKLVAEGRESEAHWVRSRKGIKSDIFSPDAKRWLNLVAGRIRPSSNVTDVLYVRAFLVACIMEGLPVNVGRQVVSEWQHFLACPGPSLMYPHLITVLCERAGVPQENTDAWIGAGPPYNPARTRKKAKRSSAPFDEESFDEGLGGDSSSFMGGSRFTSSRPSGPLERIEVDLARVRESLEELRRSDAGPSSARGSSATEDGPSLRSLAEEQKQIRKSVSTLTGVYEGLAEAHTVFRQEADREKIRRRSRDKLMVRMWHGLKSVLKSVRPQERIKKVTKNDVNQFSFLSASGLQEESSDSDEEVSSRPPA